MADPEAPEAPPEESRWIDYVPLADLRRAPVNPKRHDEALISASFDRFGYVEGIAMDERTGRLVAGHGRLGRLEQRKALGAAPPRGVRAEGDDWLVPVQRGWASADDDEAEAYVVVSNQSTIAGGFDPAELAEVLGRQAESDYGLTATGFDAGDLDALLADLAGSEAEAAAQGAAQAAARASLAERFVAPPFSVLDARQGYWQARKRAWLALGIRSELGRGQMITYTGERSEAAAGHPVTAAIRRTVKGNGLPGVDADAPESLPAKLARGGGKLGRPGRLGAELLHGKKPNLNPGGGNPRPATTKGPGGKLRKGDGAGRPINPGGSPRPAARLGPDGHTRRGDGKGREVDRAAPGGGTGVWMRSAGDGTARVAGRTYDAQGEAVVSDTAGTSGASIFDPVLCELVYRWFCPPGGRVLDPFAGGSVRGIVAGWLGRSYLGVDLSEPQIAANEAQREAILGPAAEAVVDQPLEETPVEWHGGYLVKRDDAYRLAGSCGGKVRTCWALAQGAEGGLVTAGSRQSPQVNIVAGIAARLGLPCRAHVPAGPLTPELEAAAAAGAEIVAHRPGHNSVIVARAREDAAARGWREIPFGMECEEAVAQTAGQVASLPDSARIVVAVGSGMSLAGICRGLDEAGRATPVLGVCVGADPRARLDRYAPGWRERVTLVDSPLDYHDPAPACALGGLDLDPIYEAKCLPHLAEGDLLWVVGIRQTAGGPRGGAVEWAQGDARNVARLAPPESADLVFSCPPYFDLEVYSDDPADLSQAGTPEAYFEAMEAALIGAGAALRPDRFAVLVMGEARDASRGGALYGLVPGVVQAAQAAGLDYYNEAMLVTMLGSLPLRAGPPFQASRKLGRTHQTVLVFVKGDPRAATAACGPVEVGDLAALAQLDEDA